MATGFLEKESASILSDPHFLKNEASGTSFLALDRRGSDDLDEDNVDVRLDPGSREAYVNGRTVILTATESKILRVFLTHPGEAFSREGMLVSIHEGPFAITDRAVDVQIFGLRKKLGPAAFALETVRGIGYRWKKSGSN